MERKTIIIEFLQDLTDAQKVTLLYYCLGIPSIKIAKIRGISKQAVNQHFAEIMRKRDHEELIQDLQAAICARGLFIDGLDQKRKCDII